MTPPPTPEPPQAINHPAPTASLSGEVLPSPLPACTMVPLNRPSNNQIRACRLVGPCSHSAPPAPGSKGGTPSWQTGTRIAQTRSAAAADLGCPAFVSGVGVPALPQSRAEEHGGTDKLRLFCCTVLPTLKPLPEPRFTLSKRRSPHVCRMAVAQLPTFWRHMPCTDLQTIAWMAWVPPSSPAPPPCVLSQTESRPGVWGSGLRA